MVPCTEGQRCALTLSRQRVSSSLDTGRCTKPYFSAHTGCSITSPTSAGWEHPAQEYEGGRLLHEGFSLKDSGLLRLLGRVIWLWLPFLAFQVREATAGMTEAQPAVRPCFLWWPSGPYKHRQALPPGPSWGPSASSCHHHSCFTGEWTSSQRGQVTSPTSHSRCRASGEYRGPSRSPRSLMTDACVL